MDNYLANDHHELLLENLLSECKSLKSILTESQTTKRNKLETKISKTQK